VQAAAHQAVNTKARFPLSLSQIPHKALWHQITIYLGPHT
jgi:hypothetical protein